MTYLLGDRIRVSATVAAGEVILGAPLPGFQSLAAGLAASGRTLVSLSDSNGGWIVAEADYSLGTDTLSNLVVLSPAGGSLAALGAGPLDLFVTAAAARLVLADASGALSADLHGNASSASKLATARNITLAGSLTGSATFDGSADTTITAWLVNQAGLSAGTYSNLVVSQKGLITAARAISADDVTGALGFAPVRTVNGAAPDGSGNITVSAVPSIILTGDAAGTYSAGSIAVSLAASGAAAGTYSNLTVSQKGLITAARAINAGDVTAALGFSPAAHGLPAGGVGGALLVKTSNTDYATQWRTLAADDIYTALGGSAAIQNAEPVFTAVQLDDGTANFRVGASPFNGGHIAASGDISLAAYVGAGAAAYTFTVNSAPALVLKDGGAATFAGAVTAPSFTGVLTGNASTASKLATARTLALAGDATGSISFDGSANGTITATLAASGAAAGTYNSVVVDAKGRVTSGASTAYLTAEADTLASVTGRGATTSTALSLTNATAASSTSTGALVVTGGVGIGGVLYVAGIQSSANIGLTRTGTNFAQLGIGAAAGQFRYIRLHTAGAARWDFGATNGAESGSNAGSDFYLNRWADDGTTGLGSALTIVRATGLVTVPAGLSVTASTASSSISTGALTVTGGVGIGGALNVGGALSVTGGIAPRVQSTTSSSGTFACDWSLYDHIRVVISANTVFSFAGAVEGQRCMLEIVQDGTGSRTASLSGASFGADVASYTATTTANKTDYVGLLRANSNYRVVAASKGY